jgi:hypothetical protein
MFSMSCWMSRCSSLTCRTMAGMVGRPASWAARQRRSPWMMTYRSRDSVVPHRDRLEHALLADGGGQFFQALRIEGTARLIRVRLDAVERDLACLGEFAGTACLG